MKKWLKKLLENWLFEDELKALVSKSEEISSLHKKLAKNQDYINILLDSFVKYKQELIKYKLPFLKIDQVGEWTEKDRETYRYFISQGVGAKLAATLRQWAISMNSWAVQQSTNSQFNCGVAHGFQSALAKIDEHSQPLPKKEEAQNDEDKTLESLGYFHARTNGRNDESLEHLRP